MIIIVNYDYSLVIHGIKGNAMFHIILLRETMKVQVYYRSKSRWYIIAHCTYYLPLIAAMPDISLCCMRLSYLTFKQREGQIWTKKK